MIRAVIVLSILVFVLTSAQWPCPFSRELKQEDPPLQGNDVTILQHLLIRSPYVKGLQSTGKFDAATATAVSDFQTGNQLQVDGIVGQETAQKLLDLHMSDGYKDDGKILPGFKYKVHIPVSRNRSVETTAYLYDSNMSLIYQFHVRLHGQRDWNEFCHDGNTPTGLSLFDLNSPEDDPKDFGPYPVNRVVAGLKGNAAILLQNSAATIRSGILLHTGQWDGWQPPQPMPNSDGCIHTWPDMCKQLWQTLVSFGIQVRKNSGGELPYPYLSQGLISIEQVD